MPTHDHRLTITLASGIYDITRPLINGLVEVDGVKLNVLANFKSVDAIFRKMLNLEFDASEMGISHYLLAREKGIPLLAIPVFINRLFPHSYFFRNKASKVQVAKDLAGKKIGLPQYQVSRAMWLRGILEEEYGFDRRSVTWVTEFPERMNVAPAAGVRVEKVPEGTTVWALLGGGELDAAMWWAKPPSEDVDYFFSDLKSEEIKYFKKTGIFPIMHTVAIKKELYDRHPWIARSLVDAYAKSKAILYEWRNKLDGGSMPLAKYGLFEQGAVLGQDPFPFQLQPNLKTLEAAARYSAADGFIKPVPDISQLWVNV